jgi:hypothetical protein
MNRAMRGFLAASNFCCALLHPALASPSEPTLPAIISVAELPHAENHELDTGHFLLEHQFDTAEPLIHDFLDRTPLEAS